MRKLLLKRLLVGLLKSVKLDTKIIPLKFFIYKLKTNGMSNSG